MNIAIRGKHSEDTLRLAAVLMEKCGFPDDGRWHHREYLMDGLLISGHLRRFGVESTIEVWGVSVKPYTPRIIMRTIDNHVAVKDSAS